MTPQAKRMIECPLRRAASCGDVDTTLGWIDQMPLSECDQCWAMRASGDEAGALDWRRRYTALTVSMVAAKGLEHHRADVQEAMLTRHMPCEAAAAARQKLATTPREQPKVVWLWMKWCGVPYPKRPFMAFAVAFRLFRSMMRQFSSTGCGCHAGAKKAVEVAKKVLS